MAHPRITVRRLGGSGERDVAAGVLPVTGSHRHERPGGLLSPPEHLVLVRSRDFTSDETDFGGSTDPSGRLILAGSVVVLATAALIWPRTAINDVVRGAEPRSLRLRRANRTDLELRSNSWRDRRGLP